MAVHRLPLSLRLPAPVLGRPAAGTNAREAPHPHWHQPAARRRGAAAVKRASSSDRGGSGLDDLEVAVFRFTLGIPGFDDALIPRVVGVAGAALLVLNHLLSESTPTDAQVRAEVLGAALAAVGIVTPSLERLIQERQPGRGRLAASEAVEGASRVFALAPELPEAAKQDAAWASFALLKNANICGLVAVWEGQAMLARGLVGLPSGAAVKPGDAAAALAALTQAFQASPPQAAAYWPDRAAIRGGGAALPCVPAGAQTVLLQPIQPLAEPGAAGGIASTAGGKPRGWLLLLSERPRALSAGERAWAAAVAGKLYTALDGGQ